MEQLIDFDAFFGRCLNEEGAVDRLQELKAFLCFYFSLEVAFCCDDEHESLGTAFLVKLLQPLFEPLEAFPVVNGIHKKDGSRAPIKIISDRLVNILPALNNQQSTVSQICSCTGCSSMMTIFEEKSTPTVTWYSSLNFPWMYWWISEVLPVPG